MCSDWVCIHKSTHDNLLMCLCVCVCVFVCVCCVHICLYSLCKCNCLCVRVHVCALCKNWWYVNSIFFFTLLSGVAPHLAWRMAGGGGGGGGRGGGAMHLFANNCYPCIFTVYSKLAPCLVLMYHSHHFIMLVSLYLPRSYDLQVFYWLFSFFHHNLLHSVLRTRMYVQLFPRTKPTEPIKRAVLRINSPALFVSLFSALLQSALSALLQIGHQFERELLFLNRLLVHGTCAFLWSVHFKFVLVVNKLKLSTKIEVTSLNVHGLYWYFNISWAGCGRGISNFWVYC